VCSRINCCSLNMIRERTDTDVFLHAGKAALAAATAASISSSVLSGTRDSTSWVACEPVVKWPQDGLRAGSERAQQAAGGRRQAAPGFRTGLMQSMKRSVFDSTNWPLMKFGTVPPCPVTAARLDMRQRCITHPAELRRANRTCTTRSSQSKPHLPPAARRAKHAVCHSLPARCASRV